MKTINKLFIALGIIIVISISAIGISEYKYSKELESEQRIREAESYSQKLTIELDDELNTYKAKTKASQISLDRTKNIK